MKFEKILIAVDDSKFAQNATQHGFELAHQFGAAVALVHIVEPVMSTTTNDTSMMGSMIPGLGTAGLEEVQILDAQQSYSQKLLNDTAERYGEGIAITQYNEMGSTSETIIDCAAQFGADLIVLGTHSRSGFDRFLMGSVAESVVRHSPVAVLVIPMAEEKEE